MKFEIDVEIPEGYEPTGEYRRPAKGEWWMPALELGTASSGATMGARIILRKEKPRYEDFAVRKRAPAGLLYISREDVEKFSDLVLAAVNHIKNVEERA